LIGNDQAQNYCLEGLELEIQDSEKYETQPLTEQVREKFQPQKVSGSSAIIDIRSQAKISNFEFTPNVGILSFTIDSPQYVILYIPNEFLSSKMLVTVNGQIPPEIDSQANLLDEEVSMIRFVPKTSGIVLISPIE
ncbi:MAG: thrombospondin, partial [Nitrosarchaeum sp.]